jgi:hypothetical protein
MNFFLLEFAKLLTGVYYFVKWLLNPFHKLLPSHWSIYTSTSTSHSLLQQEKNPSKISVSFFSEYVFYVVSGFLEVFFMVIEKICRADLQILWSKENSSQ